MAKKKKDDPTKVEERWVEWSDLEAGVNLKAGHPVILFLGGHTPAPGNTTTYAPGGTTTSAPGPSSTTTATPSGETTSAPPDGSTTAAPPDSTTAAPPDSTTAAPSASTTAAPPRNTTSAPPGNTTNAPPPASTTSAPAASTTATPPASTTVAPAGTTTAAPPSTTSAAPATTTSAAPTTTAAPPTTTTAAPATTTSAAPTTTTHAPNSTTTAAPPTTTTHAPTTTTHAPTTTTHAPTTTTHAPTTTTAPPKTTTAAPPTTTTAHGKVNKTQLGPDHFDTAKAFPKPEDAAFTTYRFVAKKANGTPGIQLLVLGHTDTQASDSYNLTLSTERALSVKAYLTNDVDSWYPFYSNADPQKKWGTTEDQYMLSALPRNADGSLSATPYYTGAIDGVAGAGVTAALQKFQGDAGLTASGTADEPTRRKLIAAYMAIEGTSISDTSITIQTLGCGFRNQAEDPPTGPNVASQKNRRTEIYGFEGIPITPDSSAWKASDASTNAPTYAAWQKSVNGDFTDS